MIDIILPFLANIPLLFAQYFLHKKIDAYKIKYAKRLLVLILCAIYSFIIYIFFDASEHYTPHIIIPPNREEDNFILNWINTDTASTIVITAFFAIIFSPFVAITYHSYNRNSK